MPSLLDPPPPCVLLLADITCESVSGTTKQPIEDGGEEEVETVGFKLNFTFKENPYFTNTVSGHLQRLFLVQLLALHCVTLYCSALLCACSVLCCAVMCLRACALGARHMLP